MAAAVAQPNEDITASSYVGFDCKSRPLISLRRLSWKELCPHELTISDHASDRAQAPKARFPIQRHGRRYVNPSIILVDFGRRMVRLTYRPNWTWEINNDQHPFRIPLD